jgi:hypothetical protein
MKMSNEPIGVTINGVRPSTRRISRRQAMHWVLGAVAATALPVPGDVFGQPVGRTNSPQENAAKQPPPVYPGGYGTDPNLTRQYKPGELWPLTFNEAQRKAATALADTIIPKDDLGPAASEVGVVEMIDEWISAPYPQQKADKPVIIEGLAWLDAEAGKRFVGKTFAALASEQRSQICDEICSSAKAKNDFKQPARFFSRFRSLCAGAYYATPEGWKALGYVGNVALPSFDGPPPEVLAKLGVTQTVK